LLRVRWLIRMPRLASNAKSSARASFAKRI
jgi:hypothetical protein